MHVSKDGDARIRGLAVGAWFEEVQLVEKQGRAREATRRYEALVERHAPDAAATEIVAKARAILARVHGFRR